MASLAAIGLVAWTGLCPALQAQTQEEGGFVTTLALGVRANWYASRDRLISPRPYHGQHVGQNGFFLSFESSDDYHEIDGWIDDFEVEADSGFSFLRRGGAVRTPNSELELVDVAYTYLRRVVGPWWLGFSANAHASHTKYELGAGSAEGFLYMASLGITARRDVDIGSGRSLRISVRIPLLGWVARPTYSTVDEARLQSGSDIWHRLTRGTLMNLVETQAATAGVSWTQRLHDYFGVRAAVRFDYVRQSTDEVFEEVRAGLDLGVTIRWPGGDR